MSVQTLVLHHEENDQKRLVTIHTSSESTLGIVLSAPFVPDPLPSSQLFTVYLIVLWPVIFIYTTSTSTSILNTLFALHLHWNPLFLLLPTKLQEEIVSCFIVINRGFKWSIPSLAFCGRLFACWIFSPDAVVLCKLYLIFDELGFSRLWVRSTGFSLSFWNWNISSTFLSIICCFVHTASGRRHAPDLCLFLLVLLLLSKGLALPFCTVVRIALHSGPFGILL